MTGSRWIPCWENGPGRRRKASSRRTARLAIEKSGLDKEEIRYYFGGDLLAQLIATSFGSMDLRIPMFGLYGACSTMGEGLQLGSMTVAGDFADRVLVTASSHFASAEKQFRFPLEYGNQRPLSATWTVTGCGGRGPGKRRRREPAGPGGRDHHRKDRGHGF